jgi:hypothetical protein
MPLNPPVYPSQFSPSQFAYSFSLIDFAANPRRRRRCLRLARVNLPSTAFFFNPEGMIENSPAFQRRDLLRRDVQPRTGRLSRSILIIAFKDRSIRKIFVSALQEPIELTNGLIQLNSHPFFEI